MELVRIYAKRIWLPLVFLLVILLGQLLTTRMNVYFTRGQAIPSGIEVVDLAKNAQSTDYIKRLKKAPNMQVTVTDQLNKERLKETIIQGILVLPEQFSQALENQEKGFLTYYSATGIQDTGPIEEVIVASLLQMQGERLYQVTLEKDGLSAAAGEPELSELFQVVYYNSLGEVVSEKSAKPVFTLGLAALFILLAVLYLQNYLPGADQRRFAFYGKKNLYRQQGVVGGLIFVGWLSVIGAFLFLMPLLIDGVFEKNSLISLLGVLVFCYAISFFFITIGKRQWLSFLFIPWFILNMTMGGAVWGVASEHQLVTAFLPVSYVIKGQWGPLYISAMLVTLLTIGIQWQQTRRKI
ncbi:hypothetical protein BAU15_11385 [Enterococcus sp. JM4C]|uniref:hypothetical protein n=1 Tax=Candidatus Enterococcus huntleyi TaxID=1857217 RepID=UPI001379876D|nr:hypothetical protein [Enterococcus sp. JM4C]KAF1297345.1 hypothetical protein BAU15_11385 [Enterococcus sp. JM4C]